MSEDRELSTSGEFTIHNGGEVATWNPATRHLSGDSFIISAILNKLSINKEAICDVGPLWMEQREPVAVAFVADSLGYELRGDVPEWGFDRLS